MVSTVHSQPDDLTDAKQKAQDAMILCCYKNQSPKIQIIRSFEGQHHSIQWHLERVIFPGQRLLFEAPQQSKIQILSSALAGMLVDDTVPCDRIQVRGSQASPDFPVPIVPVLTRPMPIEVEWED